VSDDLDEDDEEPIALERSASTGRKGRTGYVCIHVCVYACMHACWRVRFRVQCHACVCVRVYACVRLCLHKRSLGVFLLPVRISLSHVCGR
jgi:hypothetical protein